MSRARSIFLALLIVGSVFAGTITISEPAEAKPNGFQDVPGQNVQKSETIVDPANPPKKPLPAQASDQAKTASQSTGPPDKNKTTGPPAFVQENLNRVPDEATENVLVSDDANTTLVDVAVTNSGGLAIVVTDDVSDDGRTVAIGSNVLMRTLNQLPEFATITHESGDSTVEAINYSDGYAHINISHFSTNTVTFSGEVHLTGDPALDGTSYNYGLEDLDSVGSYAINVTGNTAYERENQSAQVGDGETVPLSIAGTADPLGPDGEPDPSIVLEGTETTGTYSTSGGPVAAGDSETITDLGGNQAPRDASITFEGARSEASRTVSQTGATSSSTKSFDVNGNLPAESEQVTLTGTATDTGRASYPLGTYSDGGSDSFSISDLDEVGNPAIDLAGKLNTETDTVSASSVSDGGTVSADIAGNIEPASSTVTFGGNEQTNTDSYSWTGLSPGSSKSITVDGNAQPSDASVSVTGHSWVQEDLVTDWGTASLDWVSKKVYISNPPEEIASLTFEYGATSSWGASESRFEIYIADGDTTANSSKVGTAVFDPGWNVIDNSWTKTETVNPGYVTDQQSGVTIEFWQKAGGDTDYTYTVEYGWADAYGPDPSSVSASTGSGSTSFGDLSDGETVTKSVPLSTSDSSMDFSASAGSLDADVSYTEKWHTESPSADIDGDGTDEASYTGILGPGETSQKSISPTLSDDTWTISTTGTTVDISGTIEEQTQTVDPSVTLNGNTYSYTGTLSDGQTTSVPIDASALQGGSNSISVSLPTLSSDAPPMEVGINAVEYDDLQYSEDPAVDVDGDGTNEISYSGELPTGQTHSETLDLEPGSYIAEPSTSTGTVDWSLDFTEVTGVENPGVDVGNDGTTDATYSGILDAGENGTVSISDGLLSTGSNTLGFDQYDGPAFTYSLEATEVTHSEDPDVDVDGDGTFEVTYSGVLSPGETTSYDVGDLTLQSDDLSVQTNAGSEVIAEAQYREVTETEDVTVSVNGNPTSYDLTLGDGETHSLAVNESWLVNGTNTVEVSVAPSIGSDAPDGQVGLDYYHTASDLVETEYKGETWTERYIVSKTWANPKENASVKIPFDSSHVIGIRDLTKTVNNGTTEPIDAANYSLERTTLTAELGDVQAGDEIRVHANGTKTLVGNGEITVTDPTIEGNVLDTGFRIDQHDPGFYLEVSGTETPDRVHHLETLSWTGADPYTEHDADGDQFLYAPNATDGGTATVQTMPLEVDPARGDVHVRLEDDNESHPIFAVEPGDDLGDEVEFGYYNTTSGETYVLNSITEEIARDTQTAESPVWLTDDDSPETLEIYEEDETATDDGGSTDGGTQYISPVSSDAWYESLPVISIGAALGLAIVAGAANYLFREWYKILGTVGTAALLELVLLTEFIWPEVILSPLSTGVREIAPTVTFILAVTIAYVVYKRWDDITGGNEEDAVTVSDDGVLRLRRK